ncbi:MAG: hypothetical protein A2V67_12755 [Deltaproteobacteria bacterium RBG_13_61_14]|nr:MAG: hypothetical protein A2V67_12755 [Deltaproteobacteria bacterium RBG_13_61_14]
MIMTVRRVESAGDLKTFLRLPWKIYSNDRNWVPPLLWDFSRKLDKSHNPYFQHAEAEYFLAFRGDEAVGRITAQKDKNYEAHWKEKVGHFGFFECADDPAAAQALLEAGCAWLKGKGCIKAQGPFNPNVNDECGLLIAGFDTPPMFLMTHNPPYYQKLLEGQGFAKAMDLLAYRLDAVAEAPPDVAKYAETIRHKEGITVRQWDLGRFEREMELFREVYNSAWERNWGMVKLTDAELKAHTVELRTLVWPELAFFAEIEGKVMGASLSLPNYNEVIIKLNGRIFPLGALRIGLARLRKSLKSCRVFALGVKQEYRRSGVGAVFYYDTLMAAKRLGLQWGEMSWILENNVAMNKAIQHMGGRVYKTYRIFEKAL